MQTTARFHVLLSLVLPLGVACDFFTGPRNEYPIPPRTNDGWETVSLEDVGMEADSLLALMDLIAITDDHMIHSILIVKDQKLVFEEYWPGVDLDPRTLSPVARDMDRGTLHYVASVSKSITSALVGIALDQGLIGSVHDSLFSYFLEYSHLKNEDNGNITLEHLLSFSSGYDWNEHVYGFDDPRDSHYQMFNTPDPMAFLLGRPSVFDPGGEFHYNSGDTNILGEIVRRTSSSQTLVEYANRYLFQPLSIEAYDWVRLPLADELTFASGGASLRPRDMAKLGALYLNGGVWNGQRIISMEWVNVSTELTTPLVGDHRALYGYNWWLGRSQFRNRDIEYFRAAGWGGQDVYVFPELELIVVFTAGGFYDTRLLNVNDIIEQYIFQAIVD